MAAVAIPRSAPEIAALVRPGAVRRPPVSVGRPVLLRPEATSQVGGRIVTPISSATAAQAIHPACSGTVARENAPPRIHSHIAVRQNAPPTHALIAVVTEAARPDMRRFD